MPGYSWSPLAKKLGIASGAKVVALHAPADYLWSGLKRVVWRELR